MGGVELLSWRLWLVVMDGNVSRYGGQFIVLRLLVSFQPCWSSRCIGFGIVFGARLELRTLGTGCLMDVQQEAGTGRRWGGMSAHGGAFGAHACGFHSFLRSDPIFHIFYSLSTGLTAGRVVGSREPGCSTFEATWQC